MNTTTTHPAIVAHSAGHSRVHSRGDDWTAYVAIVNRLPYLVTVWADGRIGVQVI